jgi:hypothetical protein
MRFSIILIVTLLLSISARATDDPCEKAVEILSTKMDIFYFKLCKDYMGAIVEVHTQDSVLLVSKEITGNKALIDFYFEKQGKFLIKIKVQGKEESFEYVKEAPPPLAVAHLDYHVVITEQ